MLKELVKVLIMNLRILSLFRYRLVYVTFSFVLFILVLNDYRYCLIIPIYFFYMYRTQRKLLGIIVVLLSIYSFSLWNAKHKSIEHCAQYELKVSNSYVDSGNTIIYGKIDRNVVKVYLSHEQQVVPGEVYRVKGELDTPNQNTIPYGFNYKNYLLSQKINYLLYSDENQINKIGISHLFAVSGLHVGLLVIAIKFLLNKIKVVEKCEEYIIIAILMLYLLATSFAPSITRAAMMYVCLIINKHVGWKLLSLDVLSIVFVGLLLYNPFYYYNIGFVLSFLVTFVLLIGSQVLKNRRSVDQLFMVGFLSFLSTFPIVLNLNNRINLLSLLFNILFIIYMSYIILPFAYITFVMPFFDNLYYVVIIMYNGMIEIFSRFRFFELTGSFTNPYEVMIFYIIIISLLCRIEMQKVQVSHFLILFIFILFVVNSHSFQPVKKVIFLDVKGDSTFISDSFNKCNILIDTGDVDEYDSVLSYLHSTNVKRLDYLIISHFHSDHYGEMSDILKDLNVVNVITSNNVSNYHDEIINCGSLSFFIYDLSYGNTNENNNSIMLSLFLNGRHFLFTGDAEQVREMEFVNNYQVDVDYLKVAHHGSITSSSDLFVDSVNPEEVIIIVKRNNIHKHPSDIIVERYITRNIVVNRTDNHGTIEILYLFDFERKKYNKP